jgi:hypothetical protein
VRLGLQLPSVFRRRRAETFLGLRAGHSSPAQVPRSGAGGGGGAPQRCLRSCWAGEGEGHWAYQEGQMGQTLVRFGQLEAQRDFVKTSR